MNRMKQWLLLATVGLLVTSANAQDEKKGFDPNRVFVGGSVGLGLGFGSNTSSFNIGLYPQIGYSFAQWFDAGVVVNSSYYSSKIDYGFEELKYTSITYGAGVFARAFPLRNVFIQAQPEINWISYKNSYTNTPTQKGTVSAPSLLLGVGFGNRNVGQSGFFTTIMLDVLNDVNSPYRTAGGGLFPIIQAGFVFYLAQKKQDKYMDFNNNSRSY